MGISSGVIIKDNTFQKLVNITKGLAGGIRVIKAKRAILQHENLAATQTGTPTSRQPDPWGACRLEWTINGTGILLSWAAGQLGEAACRSQVVETEWQVRVAGGE
jgi:hypothetical protein